MISPVFDAPLLIVQGAERVLVAADLHLGLEHELWLGGVSIPSQTEKILASLLGFLKEIKPDRLLLLGDIKHNVPRTSWQEKREVPEFLRQLCEQVIVEIVPGNHDSNLADMAPQGTQVHSSSGFVLDDVGYFHGHTWPDERVLRADSLVTAHLHPAIRLFDPLGRSSSRPVWARARLSSRAVQEHYGFEKNSEIIVAPAFNHLCGGLPLNEPVEEMRGPILSMAEWDEARLYLLDGTDLGTLAEIKSAQRKPRIAARIITATRDSTLKKRGRFKVNDRDKLLELLKDKSLELRPVTLSSGKISDYYMDCKRVTLSPEGAYLTASLMLEMIRPEVSAVAGLTLGADPIVSSISVLSHIQKRGLSGLIVRKEPKKHGTMSFVEGPALEKGSLVAVVEDVVTSGASLIRAIDRISAAGYQPVQALAILDRQEGGREAIKERGLNLQALFTRDDLEINKCKTIK